jgi:Ala-tRNA(Pro) deacylase
VVVSRALTKDEYITFNAGTHKEAIRMSFDDYENLTHPERLAFSAIAG